MCGRVACTLQPDVICKAVARRDKSGEFVPAEWKGCEGDHQKYRPSVNMSPTMNIPVTVSKKHFDKDSPSSEYVVIPMTWGIIPPWHKGTATNHGLTTNNCRVETIESKKLYSIPLNRGRRCVVICDGFYEWKAKKTGESGPKQPYFIGFPQQDNMKIEEPETWEPRLEELWSPTKGWKGPRPFMMAGLFDTWINPSDKRMIYSFSVITMDSSPAVSWIHERMPAVVDSLEKVVGWLDYEGVDTKSALKLLKPVTDLHTHPVSPLVNSVKNQNPGLSREQEIKKVETAGSKFMSAWLTKGNSSAPSKRKSEDHRKEELNIDEKKIKLESEKS